MPGPFRTAGSTLLASLMVVALASGAGSRPAERSDPAEHIGWKAHLAAVAAGRGGGEDMGRALRGSIEEMAGISFPDHEPTEADEETLWDWGWLEAVPAGDLDADGQEDALEYAYLESFEETIDDFTWLFEQRTAAVRATDGETLWSTTETNEWSYLVPAGDLDGQPGDDLLRFTIAEARVPATWLWLVGVTGVRGSDGATLWTRTYPNPFTFVESGPTWGYVDADYAIPLQVAGDVDGDGTRDLLVGRYTFAGLWDESLGDGAGSGSAVFEFVSGRTGSPVSVSPVVDGSLVDAAALEDVDGDGLDDLAVLDAAYTGTSGTLSARSGRTGREVWSAELQIPAYAWSFIQSADLSGDGRGDVLVRSYPEVIDDWDWYFGPQRVHAASGADGSALWSTELPAFTGIIPAGDANGDGGSDLLTFPRDDSWAPPSTRTAHLYPDVLMTSGADGSMVWGRSPKRLKGPDGAGDLNGDGVLDVLATIKRTDASVTRAFSGATGGRLWQFVRPSSTRQFGLGGDLDGDGGDDLQDLRHWGSSGYRIRRGTTGGSMWSGWRSAGDWVSSIAVAERVGGGPGVLLVGSEMDRTLILAGRSASGAALWTRSLDY